MSRFLTSLCAVSLLSAATGCISSSQPYLTSDRMERGLVIVLPGVEGRSPLNEAICRGLNDGGVNWAIELYDWTAPVPLIGLTMGPLYNQEAEGRNQNKADELAGRIKRYQFAYPHRPVVLVGQSGGGAIAVWAARALSGGHKVDGVILMAASLSPGYPLSRALNNSDRGIVNFYSARDWFLLGVGTTITGTMDGEHESSAGKVGFLPPSGRKPKEYSKLFQIPWTEKMGETGNSGGHMSSGATEFVSTYVAPLVLSPVWDDRLISQIVDAPPQAKPTSSRKSPTRSRDPRDE
jgi:hypothetical protein